MARKNTPKKVGGTRNKGGREEIPFGLGAIDQFNADREANEPTNLDDVESEEEEETLELGLDDEWEEGDEEEGEYEDEDITEYDFDEDAFDRKERAREMDEEDEDLLGRGDITERPYGERLQTKDVYKTTDKGDDVEEAKRLQKEQREEQELEDFEVDISLALQKAQKSKDAKMLSSFNKELKNIDLSKPEVETITKKVTKQEQDANLKEKLERIKKESPELMRMLKDFREKLNEAHNVIQPVLERAKNGALPTSEGISFLEVKNQLLLSYCINISFYLMLKAQGKQVKDHPVVDQLVRIRAIIEKSKPIEKKLSYQIDKLLRTANLGVAAGGNKDLSDRPNPAALEVDSDDEEADTMGYYRAPRGVEESMDTPEDREEKRREKEKKKRKDYKMAAFLRDEYGDAPAESTPGLASEAYEETAQERELAELEEANFKRKDMTRADKRKIAMRMQSANDVLAGRADFSDLAHFDDDYEKQQDDKFIAEKRMRAHMDMVDNRKRAHYGKVEGDEDTIVAPKRAKMAQGVTRGMMYDEEVESEEELEPHRKPRFEAGGVPEAEASMEEGGKRKASKKIEQNRGMVRQRNKDIKTPRTRQKVRYQKRIAKAGHSQNKTRSQNKAYSGESRIAKNVTRSKKYTD